MLLLVVALVAAGVWLAVAQPWRGQAAEPAPTVSAQTPTPTAPVGLSGPTPEATEGVTLTEPTPAVVPCSRNDLIVEAVTDSTEYAVDKNPQLSIRLTNDGEDDCTLNVGTTSQAFTIMSGSDTWWRSTDCQIEPSDAVVTLVAGESVETAEPLEWDRTRSSVDTCDVENRRRAPGGGATYWLDVEIGGVPSDGPAQIILY